MTTTACPTHRSLRFARHTLFALALAAITALMPATSHAQKKGEGVTLEFGGMSWVVDSMQFGVGRGISMEVGHLSNREASRPSISEMTFSRTADASSAALLRHSLAGSAQRNVSVWIVDSNGLLTEFELEGVLVSSYTYATGRDGHAVETFSLSFTQMVMRTAKDGAGYDLAAAKPL